MDDDTMTMGGQGEEEEKTNILDPKQRRENSLLKDFLLLTSFPVAHVSSGCGNA